MVRPHLGSPRGQMSRSGSEFKHPSTQEVTVPGEHARVLLEFSFYAVRLPGNPV